jgi:hypothetical protein
MRYENWKFVFCEQRVEGTLRVWAEPFVCLRLPKIFNLRMDPYERADITSNTYYEYSMERAFLVVPTQAIEASSLPRSAISRRGATGSLLRSPPAPPTKRRSQKPPRIRRPQRVCMERNARPPAPHARETAARRPDLKAAGRWGTWSRMSAKTRSCVVQSSGSWRRSRRRLRECMTAAAGRDGKAAFRNFPRFINHVEKTLIDKRFAETRRAHDRFTRRPPAGSARVVAR